jgi:hypothetical protein
MNNRKYLFLEQYSKLSSVIGSITFALLILTTGLVSNNAHANFATTESSAVAACPANHKMYYIGANPPNSTQIFPVANPPQELSWTSGSTTKTFTFEENSGNKTFTISFAGILDKNNTEGNTPFYGSINGSTSSALNLVHNSTSTINNHTLNISINRSVSKAGYEIQDVDSLTSNVIIGYFGFFPIYGNRTPYAEQVDVSTNGGRLTFNSLFHTANNPTPNTSVVTAIQGQNCSTGECDIDAYWGYKAANSVLGLRHNNTLNETSAPHAVGYSDFYFCLAPPKLIVKKALNGTRVKTNDQFEIVVSGGSIATNSFTTTGTGSTITNGTSATLSLVESTSYTITERVMNGSTLGDIANYNATYTCTNATTGSTTVMPTAAMTYNAIAKTRSFTLANATFGDEITCTITNTPGNYTFTGFVFNDNGGIARSTNPDTKSDISTTFTGNSKYFNGIFDNGETGIGSTIGLTISLTNCDGVNIGSTTSQTTSDNPLGQYKFTVPVNVIAALSPQKVCIVQAEPDPWVFSVDTTPNIRNIDLQAGKLDYKTEGSLNLDFGEVEGDYAALVLRKAQYVNDCRSTLNYTATNINTAGNTNPRAGFSESGISGSDLTPGQCIAYRITATNRANLTINNFVMRDVLQKKGENNALVTSVLIGVSNASDYANDNVPIGKNGTVKTTEFVLNPKTVRNFYFNTKYGTTVDAQ